MLLVPAGNKLLTLILMQGFSNYFGKVTFLSILGIFRQIGMRIPEVDCIFLNSA